MKRATLAGFRRMLRTSGVLETNPDDARVVLRDIIDFQIDECVFEGRSFSSVGSTALVCLAVIAEGEEMDQAGDTFWRGRFDCADMVSEDVGPLWEKLAPRLQAEVLDDAESLLRVFGSVAALARAAELTAWRLAEQWQVLVPVSTWSRLGKN